MTRIEGTLLPKVTYKSTTILDAKEHELYHTIVAEKGEKVKITVEVIRHGKRV